MVSCLVFPKLFGEDEPIFTYFCLKWVETYKMGFVGTSLNVGSHNSTFMGKTNPVRAWDSVMSERRQVGR